MATEEPSPHYSTNEPSKATHFFKVFQGLNTVIDVNECIHLMNDQIKKDRQIKNEVNILEPVINAILRKKEIHHTLAQFLHAACFSSVVSTFLKALDNNQSTTWPGLTTKLLRDHLQKSVATEMDNLNQERQNLQSTKIQDPNSDKTIKKFG